MDANKQPSSRSAFLLRSVFKSLRFSYDRTLIIFISIMLGACVTGAFVNVYLDIDSKMRKELKAYGANVLFTPQSVEKSLFFDQSDYEKSLHVIPKGSLLGASPYLFGTVRLSLGDAVMAGVDFAGMKVAKPFLEVVQGAYINVDFDERNALIGVDLAKKMELKVGSSINLVNEQSGFSTTIRIKGIVSSGDKEDGLLFVSLPLAQKVLGKAGQIHLVEAVILGDFDQINAISTELSKVGSFSAKPLARISLSEGLILDKIKFLMALVAFTVLLITSMCVNTTLSSIIFSRTKEIALLRALGASKRNVATLFGTETLLMTLFASVLGAFLGFFLSQFFGTVIFGSGIDFRFLSIPIATILSLLFAAVAAYFPIKRSLNLPVATILRGE